MPLSHGGRAESLLPGLREASSIFAPERAGPSYSLARLRTAHRSRNGERESRPLRRSRAGISPAQRRRTVCSFTPDRWRRTARFSGSWRGGIGAARRLLNVGTCLRAQARASARSGCARVLAPCVDDGAQFLRKVVSPAGAALRPGFAALCPSWPALSRGDRTRYQLWTRCRWICRSSLHPGRRATPLHRFGVVPAFVSPTRARRLRRRRHCCGRRRQRAPLTGLRRGRLSLVLLAGAAC